MKDEEEKRAWNVHRIVSRPRPVGSSIRRIGCGLGMPLREQPHHYTLPGRGLFDGQDRYTRSGLRRATA
jgi:hypothetical protein